MVKAISSSVKMFLSDERKPEINVLYSWAVVLPQIFRKIVLIGVKPLNSTNAVQIWLRHGILKGKKASLPVDICGSKTTFKPGGTPYERGGDARRLA